MTHIVYAIRLQRAGIILQSLSVERPTKEAVEAVRLKQDPGGWATVVELPIAVPIAAAKHFATAAEPEPEAPIADARIMPKLVFKASGTVTNPR